MIGFERLPGGKRYPTFGLRVDDLRRDHRAAHPGEVASEDHDETVYCNADGKSGFFQVYRVAKTPDAVIQSTTMLIEDNTVTARVSPQEFMC